MNVPLKVPRRSPLESHVVLAILLGSFVLLPLTTIKDSSLGLGALRVGFQVVFVVTLLTLVRRRALLWTGLTLVIASSVVRLLPLLTAAQRNGWANLIGAALLALVIVVSIRRLFTERKVDAELISGALSVFLLIGLLWALIYMVLEWLQPGSFRSTGPTELALTDSHLHYFSYVTLTTLGYGDVVPTTPFARSLALLEAVIGQIYLVILVARLVALHVAGQRED